MIFGLKENILSKINEVFASFPEVEEAILYGSRAKGNYKHGSDIDLTLKGNKLNTTTLNKITSRIDDLLMPYSVDISILRIIKNPDLLDHINRIGVPVYKKGIDFISYQKTEV